MAEKPMKVMLIEDDQIERMKFNRVLSKLEQEYEIIETNNGEEALEKLCNEMPLPDIVLMDLNMPRLNGIEFLRILKADDRLRYIPCMVLTTSSNPTDLHQCYELGIAGYFLKPLRYEDYISTIKKVLAYWDLNQLITRT